MTVLAILLRTGKTRSCGCLRRETTAKRATTHGYGKGGSHRHPLYRFWLNMKQRCTNPNTPDYKHYGAKGITVCDRWMHSFAAVLEDMGEKPTHPDDSKRKRNTYSMDRIDNNGPYCKENCRWSTQTEQMNNTRRNQRITFNGETLTRSQWEHRMNLPKEILKQRFALGWTIERALTTPSGRPKQ